MHFTAFHRLPLKLHPQTAEAPAPAALAEEDDAGGDELSRTRSVHGLVRSPPNPQLNIPARVFGMSRRVLNCCSGGSAGV